MGSAHQRSAAEGLLRQRAARRHGRGLSRTVRHLFRNNRRTSLWLRQQRRHLDSHCSRSACRIFGRSSDAAMIRVVLPYHLRNLARVDGEAQLEVQSPATVRSVLDALEARYPVLRGTVRDHGTLKRRPFVRFFACKEDLSLEPPETQLPDEVVSGAEPFLIVGAMAGG